MMEFELNHIYNTDCMKAMKYLPDKYFELAIVDPPYGINATKMSMGSNPNRQEKGQYGGTSTAVKLRKGRLNSGVGKLKDRALNTMSCDWDFEKPTPEYFKELFRVSKNQIIWGGNYFDLPPTRCIICWDKMQPWDNFSQWEMAWTSFDRPAVMFRISNRGGANREVKIHPTQKPVKLYKKMITMFATPGDKLLDTHGGSCPLGIAAHDLGHDYIIFEKDLQHYKDGSNRVNENKRQMRFI